MYGWPVRSFGLCGLVLAIRVADRVTEGGCEKMSDRYTPRNEGSLFRIQSICACPLSKVDRNSAQFIYPDTVVIFEVKWTRENFGN